jgi:hypothetical protein
MAVWVKTRLKKYDRSHYSRVLDFAQDTPMFDRPDDARTGGLQ